MSGIGLLRPDVCEVQLAHDHVQPRLHVQLHHPEALKRLQVQIQVQVLILIHIRCCYLGAVTVFDS